MHGEHEPRMQSTNLQGRLPAVAGVWIGAGSRKQEMNEAPVALGWEGSCTLIAVIAPCRLRQPSVSGHPYYQHHARRPEQRPNAVQTGRRTVSPPSLPKLTDADLERIVDATCSSFRQVPPADPGNSYIGLAPRNFFVRQAGPPKEAIGLHAHIANDPGTLPPRHRSQNG